MDVTECLSVYCEGTGDHIYSLHWQMYSGLIGSLQCGQGGGLEWNYWSGNQTLAQPLSCEVRGIMQLNFRITDTLGTVKVSIIRGFLHLPFPKVHIKTFSGEVRMSTR